MVTFIKAVFRVIDRDAIQIEGVHPPYLSMVNLTKQNPLSLHHHHLPTLNAAVSAFLWSD